MGVQRPAADAAALGDDHTVRAGCGHHDVGRHRVGLVLQREHTVFAHPHPIEEQLGVAANQLRSPGDVGVDAFKAAVVKGHDVVLDRLDQPKALQLSQFLGILLREVMRLRPVVGSVELPDVVVERRRGVGLPWRAVFRHRRPALVVDTAIAHHFEVLDDVCLRRSAVAQRRHHADTLERRLRDAVHAAGAGSPAASRIVGATSMTWWNWLRVLPLSVNPFGQCTMVPLRVPPQCDATCLVH